MHTHIQIYKYRTATASPLRCGCICRRSSPRMTRPTMPTPQVSTPSGGSILLRLSCHFLLLPVTSCCFLSLPITSYHFLLLPVTSCPFLSLPITSYHFRLLPITSYYPWCLLLVCRRSKYTPRHKNSCYLPPHTTRLSLHPNHHPQRSRGMLSWSLTTKPNSSSTFAVSQGGLWGLRHGRGSNGNRSSHTGA